MGPPPPGPRESLARLGAYARRYRRPLALGVLALLLTDAAGAALPWLIKLILDGLQAGHATLPLLGLLVATALLRGLFRYFWRTLLQGTSRRIEVDLRQDYYERLLALDQATLRELRVGDLMSRAVSDMRAVRELMASGILSVIDTLATVIPALALMLVLDPGLTLAVLLPLPLVSVAAMIFGRRIQSGYQRVQEGLSGLSARLQEDLSGVRLLQAYGREEATLRRFHGESDEQLGRTLALARWSSGFLPVLDFIVGVSMAVALGGGAVAILQGRMTIGSLVAFMGYLGAMVWPLEATGTLISVTQRGLTACGRLFQVMDLVPAIRDAPGVADPGPLSPSLEVRDLSFQHGDRGVLEDVSLQLAPGRLVGLTGPLGGGKSTLLSALVRLHEVPSGRVLVGGHDVRALPLRRLRRTVGLVLQEPFLFSATLRENLLFGAEEADAEALVRRVALAGEVERFPQGLETLVGERGLTLSGGQRQRVALARALGREAPILLLDDPFSSLDTETEREILRGLREGDRALLLVSHRAATLQEADEILVLEGGRVTARGTHEELARLPGFYQRLVERQERDG